MLGGLKAKKGTGDPVAREVFCDEENVAFNPTFNHMDRTAVNDTADIATESLPPLFFFSKYQHAGRKWCHDFSCRPYHSRLNIKINDLSIEVLLSFSL